MMETGSEGCGFMVKEKGMKRWKPFRGGESFFLEACCE